MPPFGPIEISSTIFLTIFTLLLLPSTYIWTTYLRAGYHFRHGFWGAFILCLSRIACFISSLIFYSTNYTSKGAFIAFTITLSIGYIGLLECSSALFITWAESHVEFNPLTEKFHERVRVLNIVGMILIVYGSSQFRDLDVGGDVSGTPLACIQAGTIIFLILTVIQGCYILFGWAMYAQMSKTLLLLLLSSLSLHTRIIFTVYSTFNRSVSMINYTVHNLRYLIGCTLLPETLSLILLLTAGWMRIHSKDFKEIKEGYVKEKRRIEEAYNFERLEAGKRGQVVGERA